MQLITGLPIINCERGYETSSNGKTGNFPYFKRMNDVDNSFLSYRHQKRGTYYIVYSGMIAGIK